MHAGTWGPGDARQYVRTAGDVPEGCSAEQGENLAPCFGLQFFGHVDIDGATEVMTVTLKDVEDRDLWSTGIEPIERWPAGASALQPSGSSGGNYRPVTNGGL